MSQHGSQKHILGGSLGSLSSKPLHGKEKRSSQAPEYVRASQKEQWRGKEVGGKETVKNPPRLRKAKIHHTWHETNIYDVKIRICWVGILSLAVQLYMWIHLAPLLGVQETSAVYTNGCRSDESGSKCQVLAVLGCFFLQVNHVHLGSWTWR